MLAGIAEKKKGAAADALVYRLEPYAPSRARISRPNP